MIKTLILGISTFIAGCLVFYLLYLVFPPIFIGGFFSNSNWHAKAYQSLEKRIWGKMDRKHQLHMSSFGGIHSEEIGPVHFSFRTYQEHNKDEARVLLVEVMEEIKEEINKVKELRPYLIQYPMSEDEIGVSISFYNPETHENSMLPLVSGVSSLSGKVKYSEEGKNSFEDMMAVHETYREAKLKADAYLTEKKKSKERR